MSTVPPDPRDPKLSPQEQENLTAYLDHELDDAGSEAITAALSRRPEVRKEADSLRKTWEMLDYLPRPQAPKTFMDQTITRLNSTKGILLQQGIKWRRYAIAGWAACLLTAAAFGFWLTYSLGREPEIVEVHPPVADVIPVMESAAEKSVPEPHPTTEAKAAKKDARVLQRVQEAQRRNDRLTNDIKRLYHEVRKKLSPKEEERLILLSGRGGVPYMAALIELAKKYEIPLTDPNESTTPATGKPNKKAAKSTQPGE